MPYQEEINARNFFSPEEEDRIVATIAEAEDLTSGEIRLHLEDECFGNVHDRARKVFEILEMHLTDERNGILVYVAVKDRKFGIFADIGINERVPSEFWEEVLAEMQKKFKRGEFLDGVTFALQTCGKVLSTCFPYGVEDSNELPDSISFGKP